MLRPLVFFVDSALRLSVVRVRAVSVSESGITEYAITTTHAEQVTKFFPSAATTMCVWYPRKTRVGCDRRWMKHGRA